MFKVKGRLAPHSLLLIVMIVSACRQQGPSEPDALVSADSSIELPVKGSSNSEVLTQAGPPAAVEAATEPTETSPAAQGGSVPTTAPPAVVEDPAGTVSEPGAETPPTVTPAPASTPAPSSSPPIATVAALANGVYTIKGTGSSKCLQPEVTAAGALPSLIQFTCSTASTQKFTINFVDSKFYTFVNVGSGKAVEIKDAIAAKVGRIQLNTPTALATQQFTIIKLADGRFNVKPLSNSLLCLDVSFGSKDDNAFMQLWDQCNLPNESWIITPATL